MKKIVLFTVMTLGLISVLTYPQVNTTQLQAQHGFGGYILPDDHGVGGYIFKA